MQYSISALADSNETIRVQGMGELKIMPEVASINYDITTKNKDSKKAQETNNVEAIRIDKLLKSEHKIEEKDLATQGYQVNPDYDWTDNKRVFKGFTVVHHRSILIRNIKDAGKILDELYSTSNTEQKTINIHGIYYFTLKKQQYERECIQLAMDDAEGKAEIMAKKAKRGIKKVLRISDSTQQWQQPTPTPMMYSKSASMSTMSMSERSADTSVPVSSGEMSFTTTVHVEFEMQ
jgi:uncharacterized protein YggE